MGYLKSVEHQQFVQADHLGILIQIMIAEPRFSGKLYVLQTKRIDAILCWNLIGFYKAIDSQWNSWTHA